MIYGTVHDNNWKSFPWILAISKEGSYHKNIYWELGAMTLHFNQTFSVPTWDEDIHQFVIFILDLVLTQSKHKAFFNHPVYIYVTPIWLDVHMIWQLVLCFSGQNLVFNLDFNMSIARLGTVGLSSDFKLHSLGQLLKYM